MLLGISADSPFSHAAFLEARKISFPLLSDIHRTAIRAYGVLDEDRNVAWRSTFVVDREGDPALGPGRRPSDGPRRRGGSPGPGRDRVTA